MAHPLPLSYQWRTPVVVSSAGLVLCVGALARSQPNGWVTVAVLLVLIWAAFVAVVALRCRAYLMVDGDRLVLRRYRGLHVVQAAQLRRVSEFLTPHGPSYRLTVQAPDGSTARYVAPAALLRGGHSTLFGWILARAPQAELDKGSRKTVERLRIRGLVP